MAGQVCIAYAGEDALAFWETDPLRETGRMDIAAMAGMKGLGPRRLAWDPLYKRLYVSCSFANCVGVVDMEKREWLMTVFVGSAPTDVCVCGDRVLVCCCESESLWALDREDPSAVGCVRLPGFPYSMDNSNHTLLLCCITRPAVWSVDKDLAIAGVLELACAPMHATKLPGGDMLVTLLPGNGFDAGRLVRLDRKGRVVYALEMGEMPGVVRLSEDNGLAAAVNMEESELFLVDPDTFSHRKRRVCAMPDDVLFLPNGAGILATCMIDNRAVHLDMRGKPVQCATAGKEPRGMVCLDA